MDYHYFAMLTRTGDDAESDSRVNLIGTKSGQDFLDDRFGDTAQADLERGKANLYRREGKIEGFGSSFRVGLLGEDAWEPELMLLWTTDEKPKDPSQRIVPLAFERNVHTILSTNDSDAVQSMPIRSATNPDGKTVTIQRLLMIIETVQDRNDFDGIGDTDAVADSGTVDRITLQIVANGAVVVNEIIPDTSQDDLKAEQANIYPVPVAVPFTREGLKEDAIRLSILGGDAWRPRRLFVFGLNTKGDRNYVMPLVHEDPWTQGSLSTDSSEGQDQVILPLEVMPSF